jgi:TPR repeat protein
MQRIFKRLVALAVSAAIVGFAPASRADDGTAQAVMGLFGAVLNQMQQQQPNTQPQSQTSNIQWSDTKPKHKTTVAKLLPEIATVKAKAEQGDSYAQVELGYVYEDGHAVQQDYAEAMRWFRMAAEAPDRNDASIAQVEIGLMYANAQGVKEDYTEAANWFRKAKDKIAAAAEFLSYLEKAKLIKSADPAENQSSTAGLPTCDSEQAKTGLKQTYESGPDSKVLNTVFYELQEGEEYKGDHGARSCVGVAQTNSGKKYIQYSFEPSKSDPDQFYISLQEITSVGYLLLKRTIHQQTQEGQAEVLQQTRDAALMDRGYLLEAAMKKMAWECQRLKNERLNRSADETECDGKYPHSF